MTNNDNLPPSSGNVNKALTIRTALDIAVSNKCKAQYIGCPICCMYVATVNYTLRSENDADGVVSVYNNSIHVYILNESVWTDSLNVKIDQHLAFIPVVNRILTHKHSRTNIIGFCTYDAYVSFGPVYSTTSMDLDTAKYDMIYSILNKIHDEITSCSQVEFICKLLVSYDNLDYRMVGNNNKDKAIYDDLKARFHGLNKEDTGLIKKACDMIVKASSNDNCFEIVNGAITIDDTNVDLTDANKFDYAITPSIKSINLKDSGCENLANSISSIASHFYKAFGKWYDDAKAKYQDKQLPAHINILVTIEDYLNKLGLDSSIDKYSIIFSTRSLLSHIYNGTCVRIGQLRKLEDVKTDETPKPVPAFDNEWDYTIQVSTTEENGVKNKYVTYTDSKHGILHGMRSINYVPEQ